MNPDNCIFCKIVAGVIPSTQIYEDDVVYAFEDIHPQAPVHVLAVPRRHFDQLHTSSIDDIDMLGRVMMAAGEVAKIKGIADTGYRVTINQGADGGQEVYHLHAHIMGGRRLLGMG